MSWSVLVSEAAEADLAEFPEARPLVRDVTLAAEGYRWVPVGGCLAFYTVDQKGCAVVVERLLWARSS